MLAEFIGDQTQLLKHALVAAIIIVLAVVVYLPVTRAIGLAVKKGAIPKAPAGFFKTVLKISVWALAVLLVLQEFGVLHNVWTAVLAVLGLVAIGFVAVWSILSNILCTLIILVFKPFQIGEVIEIPGDGLKGQAIDLNFLYTTLKDSDGTLIQIPNNTFFQKPIKRIAGEKKLPLEEQLYKDRPYDSE